MERKVDLHGVSTYLLRVVEPIRVLQRLSRDDDVVEETQGDGSASGGAALHTPDQHLLDERTEHDRPAEVRCKVKSIEVQWPSEPCSWSRRDHGQVSERVSCAHRRTTEQGCRYGCKVTLG